MIIKEEEIRQEPFPDFSYEKINNLTEKNGTKKTDNLLEHYGYKAFIGHPPIANKNFIVFEILSESDKKKELSNPDSAINNNQNKRDTELAPGTTPTKARTSKRREAFLAEATKKDENLLVKWGLKFHIALPEWDRKEFSKGWDIVKNILIFHKIKKFKVIRSHKKMSDNPLQPGKDITIYTDREFELSTKKWQNILQEITFQLTAAKIPPGYEFKSTPKKGGKEIAVPGSNYISYRYAAYGVTEQDDLIAKEIIVQVADQIERSPAPQVAATSSSATSVAHPSQNDDNEILANISNTNQHKHEDRDEETLSDFSDNSDEESSFCCKCS